MSTSIHCTPISDIPSIASSSLNLLPFHLKYNGPAPISTYFQPRQIPAPLHLENDSTTKSTSDTKTITVAAFRGRRIQAHEAVIPDGYIGLLLSAPPIPTAATIDVPVKSTISTRADRLRSTTTFEEDQNGLRRSPRKRKMGDGSESEKVAPRVIKKKMEVKKFSLDSDSEDEEDEKVGKEQELEGNLDDTDTRMAGQDKTENKVDGVESNGEKDMDSMEVDDGTFTIPNATPSGIQSQSNTNDIIPTSPLTPLPSSQPNPFLDDDTRIPHSSFNPFNHSQADFDTDKLEPSLRILTPSAKFSSFTIWSPDGALDPGRDEYVRALGEWIDVGRELHRSVFVD